MDRFFQRAKQVGFPSKTFQTRRSSAVIAQQGYRPSKAISWGTPPLEVGPQIGGVYICPNCGGPVFFDQQKQQYPSPALGNSVLHVPEMLNALHEEARRSTAQNCFTGAVLLCRKILMHIAVEKSAKEKLSFFE
jgi:hypothetical protein